jgi:hypothetical protein
MKSRTRCLRSVFILHCCLPPVLEERHVGENGGLAVGPVRRLLLVREIVTQHLQQGGGNQEWGGEI